MNHSPSAVVFNLGDLQRVPLYFGYFGGVYLGGGGHGPRVNNRGSTE